MKERLGLLTAAAMLILCLVIYWSTSYPSITWWDASEYSAAAACLGITGAPGSIILIFCGWTLSKLTSQNPAFLFNLFAGLIASLTVVLAFGNTRKIQSLISDRREEESGIIENISLFTASGIIICSATLWEYAIMFTPYILTALFTMFVLMAVLHWWKNADRSDSWKSLFTVTLLIGVDFSVHRTNAVLIPGILVMMVLRNPRVFLSYKSYAAAFAGICLGLSIQLLYIPMSLNDPALNIGEPNSLSKWWNFVSLRQYGGNFLLDVFVRKGPLWSYQIPNYFRGFAENFFYLSHSTFILGFAPALLGLSGMVCLFASNRKLASALSLLFVITIASSIIYFNVPENYFRSLYRHYLPTYIIFSVFILLGVLYVIRAFTGLSQTRRRIVYLSLCGLLLGIFFTQYSANILHRNGPKHTFTVDHATNVIDSVDKNGIVFSDGDSNFFPELYLQIAERKRPDILHCNLGMLNLDWYVRQIQRHDKTFPFNGNGIDVSKIGHKNWETEYANIPIDDGVKQQYSSNADTVHLMLPALRGGNSNLLEDLVVFDVIKNNEWKRPIYFVKQGLEPELYNWLRPYLSDEGLVYKLVPDSSNMLNVCAVEKTLGKARLGGYNDHSLALDDVSIRVGNLYYGMFLNVVEEKMNKGDVMSASKYLEQMTRMLPVERLRPNERVLREVKEMGKFVETRVHQ